MYVKTFRAYTVHTVAHRFPRANFPQKSDLISSWRTAEPGSPASPRAPNDAGPPTATGAHVTWCCSKKPPVFGRNCRMTQDDD